MASDLGVPERVHVLMMAVIDGESTQAEREELERLMAGDERLKAEWARLTRVKEATTTMTVRRPSEETWDRYWSSVYNRTERKVAWLLVLAGLVVLVAYGLWHAVPALAEGLLGASELPVVVRGAIVALLTGAVLLIISVLREQLSGRRNDTYEKGVSR